MEKPVAWIVQPAGGQSNGSLLYRPIELKRRLVQSCPAFAMNWPK